MDIEILQRSMSRKEHRFQLTLIRFGPRQDGTYRVLIPAKTQLLMKTTAPGYIDDSRLLGPVAEDSDPQIDIKLRPAVPK
jgi:hypothetical protein